MMYQASELRKGIKIEIDGAPYIVYDFEFLKPGKGQSIYKCRMKNMITGSTLERSYRSGDTFAQADIEERKVEFLYQDGDGFHFMDNTSFEQFALQEDQVGDAKNFLKENTEVNILFHNEKSIGITVPNFMNLKIVECEPGIKGDTVSGATKPATLETGYVIKVPLFVERDETIKVDTRTGEYVERIKG